MHRSSACAIEVLALFMALLPSCGFALGSSPDLCTNYIPSTLVVVVSSGQEPAPVTRQSLATAGPKRFSDGSGTGGAEADAIPANASPALVAELVRVDAMRRDVESGTPIERWHFEDVRTGYQSLLKKSSGDAKLEDALRARLTRLEQRERAASSAATITTILARSHERDRVVVELKRRLNTSATTTSRHSAYQAVGVVQPCVQSIDGHRLFVLVGRNGATVCYLDIPPGLDPQPVLARKVGVRGVARYNEELQTRVISVRDLQRLDPEAVR
jgi:hypothetical protein